MSKNKPLRLWNKDAPEPRWYNQAPDPSSRTAPVELPERNELKRNLISFLKQFVDGAPRDYDALIGIEKRKWIEKGGGIEIFDEVLSEAFLESKFYKNFSKKTKETQRY